MLVGEAGGEGEHYARRPFVGKSGGVLTVYLRAAGIARPDIYITNTYPFWPGPGNPDPTAEQIAREEWRLLEDLQRVRPKVIGTVGKIATQWFLGVDEDFDMETVHGTVRTSERWPTALIVPIYHPAAGFYDPTRAAYSQQDFFTFANLLKNPVEPGRAPKIKVVDAKEGFVRYHNGACDTEGLPDKPWGLSWSGDGKTTEVWIAGPDKPPPALTGFIEFHNAPHDLYVLRALGIDTDSFSFGDTMVRLFNLQLEPQGLKAAALRHLNLKMDEYDSVVRPFFNQAALKWLRTAAKFEYERWDERPVADFAKKKWRLYRPQGPGQRLKSLLKSYEKKPTEIKLEKRWRKLNETADLPVENKQTIESKMVEAGFGEFPEFSIFLVPKKIARKYSGIDAAATRLLVPKLDKMIDERGLRGVYEMDRRALRFVDRMQRTGIRVDPERLDALADELRDARESAHIKVKRAVGYRWFNPGSGDQVARWLYDVKGLPVLRYTDTGRGSTSDEALQMLRGYHAQDPEVSEFIQGVQDYREADKYLGTFLLPIKGYLQQDPDGHWLLHANFRVTRVVSGRLSSHEPNILAIPTRTPLGRKIRTIFVARDGYVVLSVDASQIELRVMAHHCRDQKMRMSFEEGIDLHALTASILFGVAYESFKSPPSDAIALLRRIQRYVAKTINFAVMYGISAKALLEQLYKANIFTYTIEQCQGFIDEWFRIYPAVLRYLRKLWDQAEKDGFVRCMWGRMCYVPNLRVMDSKLRESAQRLCGNFPIQSGAHGLVKRAEIRLDDWLLETGQYERKDVLPWLQMHDELLLEVREGLVEETAEAVKVMMQADQRKILVPLESKAAWAESWGALEK